MKQYEYTDAAKQKYSLSLTCKGHEGRDLCRSQAIELLVISDSL